MKLSKKEYNVKRVIKDKWRSLDGKTWEEKMKECKKAIGHTKFSLTRGTNGSKGVS